MVNNSHLKIDSVTFTDREFIVFEQGFEEGYEMAKRLYKPVAVFFRTESDEITHGTRLVSSDRINKKEVPSEDGTEFTAGMPTREKQNVDITSEDNNKTFIEESNEPILNDEKAIREVLQTYDSVANASYTVLAHNRTVAKTVVVSEHCNVDIDAEGYPVGIEVLFRTPHQTENNKTSEVNN